MDRDNHSDDKPASNPPQPKVNSPQPKIDPPQPKVNSPQPKADPIPPDPLLSSILQEGIGTRPGTTVNGLKEAQITRQNTSEEK
jgi:hypothetical protein